MDWLAHAQNDWEIYGDKDRIKKYVVFNKITPEEYELIIGEPYQAA